ncbi:MAG TPA: hypothetical protein VFE82_19545 [Ramlibacter sp.]|jgi:hypothetical protein|uniref:hypothetical protein n=1 Tax=Ramlibacter sp. TaxID=1917967 RepID=UPI002D43C241|nr:hypothetical protein [Ramlibacter sp.]HZY20675.1 hypothetical protein [Ramlibacter sp.]
MQLVLADSEVAGVELQGDTLVLRFAAAAIAQAAGGEAGYLPGLALEFRQARWRGEPSACFGRLAQGELSDGISRLTRLELPFDGPGPWRAEFVFSQGSQLVVDAQRVTALPGAAPLRPSYAC